MWEPGFFHVDPLDKELISYTLALSLTKNMLFEVLSQQLCLPNK